MTVTEIPLYRNNSTPMAIVTIVSGNPTLKYSQKDMEAYRRAFWTTIRFAMDPSTVRFPARVEAIARTSHARLGSAK